MEFPSKRITFLWAIAIVMFFTGAILLLDKSLHNHGDRKTSTTTVFSTYYVAPELRDAVHQFFIEAAARGLEIPHDGLTVIFHDLTGDTIGLSNGHRSVFIDRETTLMLDNSEEDRLTLECLVFHELGHALLRREHTGGLSLMNSSGQSDLFYKRFPSIRKHMIDELFIYYSLTHKKKP